jgi:hypothetical protein
VLRDRESLKGLTEVLLAFVRCKDVEAAKRCVRVYVKRDETGEPQIVFGWAAN